MIGRCDSCGNEQSKTFEVRMARKIYIFDTFECAIQLLASSCANCGCKVTGHGLQVGDSFYCSAHCAQEAAANRIAEPAAELTAQRPLA